MEGRLFEDLVVSRGGPRRLQAGGMPASFALHAAGLTALFALSLVVPEGLPAPPRPLIGDVVFATGPRAPTPARPLQPIARALRGDRRAVAPVFELPVDAPPIEPEAFAPDDAIGCVGCALPGGSPAGGAGDERGDDGDGEGTGAARMRTDPVRVGGLIQAPRKIRHVAPAYPELARTAGIAGVVILECVIDRDGLVQSVQVLSGHPLLNAAAVSAVRQWAYTPTRLNGVAVEIVMTVTVRFTTRN